MIKENENSNEENPISIGDVSGNVIISQNQTGGITAHTVINNLEIPEPEYLWGILSLNMRTGDHYNTKIHFEVDSRVPVQWIEIRVKGKTFSEININPLSGGSVRMEGHSGKRDWGVFKTILNAFGKYEISLDSKELEEFNDTTLEFVHQYK